jgi:hypothetical protein
MQVKQNITECLVFFVASKEMLRITGFLDFVRRPEF